MLEDVRFSVLSPTAGPATGKFRPASRPTTLDHKVLGAIWNSRPHGDKIIHMVVELLRQRYGIREFIFRAKPYIGNIAPAEIYDELARRCDAVITGVGD
ncbi:MAG: hypothetical protein ACE5IG_06890 [Dehalococcoidia bacterium]